MKIMIQWMICILVAAAGCAKEDDAVNNAASAGAHTVAPEGDAPAPSGDEDMNLGYGWWGKKTCGKTDVLASIKDNTWSCGNKNFGDTCPVTPEESVQVMGGGQYAGNYTCCNHLSGGRSWTQSGNSSTACCDSKKPQPTSGICCPEGSKNVNGKCQCIASVDDGAGKCQYCGPHMMWSTAAKACKCTSGTNPDGSCKTNCASHQAYFYDGYPNGPTIDAWVDPKDPSKGLKGQCKDLCEVGYTWQPHEKLGHICNKNCTAQGAVNNSKGECVCTTSAPFFNASANACQACPAGTKWSGTTCISSCPQGATYNPSINNCQCNSGTVWNGTICTSAPNPGDPCTNGAYSAKEKAKYCD